MVNGQSCYPRPPVNHENLGKNTKRNKPQMESAKSGAANRRNERRKETEKLMTEK
jgi:hypothetical protein